MRSVFANLCRYSLIAAAIILAASSSLRASDEAKPIRIGFSMSLTGGVAVNGKQLLLALEIWRDDVNASGGLLGRPVEFVYYDDQSNPAMVPGIYTKLIDVDKVDLTIGPYATNMVAPAIVTLMDHKRLTIAFFGVSANSEFHYSKYFSMISLGPDPKTSMSRGFFELAAQQTPRPKTVAIIGADAEFARNTTDGARQNANALGFQVIYDKSYPPATTDFGPIVRAIQATSPDMVFAAAYPPDTLGIVRAAHEIGLQPKLFGGGLIGLLATGMKVQLGPLLNGIVKQDLFVNSPKFEFHGLRDMLRKYQAKATGYGVDPLGYAFSPFGYAGGQVLAEAVRATGGLDQDKLAEYMHSHTFETVVGKIGFGKDGEWSEPRVVWTQFQGVADGSLEQFRELEHEAIVWPPDYRTGSFIYPYASALK
jgi:branched-chain amino acid transport system substrate-binding protein